MDHQTSYPQKESAQTNLDESWVDMYSPQSKVSSSTVDTLSGVCESFGTVLHSPIYTQVHTLMTGAGSQGAGSNSGSSVLLKNTLTSELEGLGINLLVFRLVGNLLSHGHGQI